MTHPLIEELNENKRQFKEKAQTVLKKEFKAFFDKHLNVGSVVWVQYTPYFMDGDPCEFSVGNFEFRSFLDDGKIDDDYAYSSNDMFANLRTKRNGLWNSTKLAYDNPVNLSGEELAFYNDADDLRKLCQSLDEIMKDIFGDHCKVVTSRNGFDVSEFEHD